VGTDGEIKGFLSLSWSFSWPKNLTMRCSLNIVTVTMRYFLNVVTVTMRYSLDIVTVTMCNLFLQGMVNLSFSKIYVYIRGRGRVAKT
jgi:hypothetical protein